MFEKKQLLLAKNFSQYTMYLQVILPYWVFISWKSKQNWQYCIALKKQGFCVTCKA